MRLTGELTMRPMGCPSSIHVCPKRVIMVEWRHELHPMIVPE